MTHISEYDLSKRQQRHDLRACKSSRPKFAINRQALGSDRQTFGPTRRQNGSCRSTAAPCRKLNRRYSYKLEHAVSEQHFRHKCDHICCRGLFHILYSLRLFVLSLIIGTTLAACDNARATNQTKGQADTKPVTRAECLARDLKVDKLECLKKLSEQRKIELADANRKLEVEKARSTKLSKETERLLKDFEKDVLDEE